MRRRRRRLLLAVLLSAGVSAGLVAVPTAAHAADYSAPLGQAIAGLPTATESRTGYSRDLFRHWVDADRDGRRRGRRDLGRALVLLLRRGLADVGVTAGENRAEGDRDVAEWLPAQQQCRYLPSGSP